MSWQPILYGQRWEKEISLHELTAYLICAKVGEILIYVLLDTQSDTTFVLEDNGLNGIDVKLALSTMYAENRSRLATLLSSLIARWWVWLQTLWWFQLGDLSIDEMIGAWCFWLLSGPPGFACWISFAPVFSFMYCFISFYILIYIF